MSSFVKYYSDGSIWGCLDDFFKHHQYGYIKLKNIEEWYTLGKDDVDWKDRVITEKKFQEAVSGLAPLTEPTPEMKEASARARELLHLSPGKMIPVDEIKPIVKKPDAIIFDCDGTLLHCDLPPYNKQCLVTPKKSTIQIMRMLWRQPTNPVKVIVLTGRHEDLRQKTKEQFLAHNIFCDELIMNDMVINGKKQPGSLFKMRKLQSLVEQYNIIGMFEDDPTVIHIVRVAFPEINLFQVYDDES